MYIKNEQGLILEHVYECGDRFYEDLDHFIKDNYVNTADSNNLNSLIDTICGHLNYWNDIIDSDEKARVIYHDFFEKNKNLSRIIACDLNPAIIIEEFNGFAVYQSFSEDDFIQQEHYENILVKLEFGGTLVFSAHEFTDCGGDITFENEKEVLFELSLTNINYFMSKQDEKDLIHFLVQCFSDLNNTYRNFGHKIIIIH